VRGVTVKGKVPGYYYYPGDFARDTRGHGLEIKGALHEIMDCVCFKEGEATLPLAVWARIFEVDDTNAQRIIDYISAQGLCDISVTSNKNVTIRSRRMYRDAKAKKNNRIRQAKHRSNAPSNTKVTPPFSSSVSSSTSKVVGSSKKPTQPDVLTLDQIKTLTDHFLGHDETGLVDPTDQADLKKVFDMIFAGKAPRWQLAYLKHLATFDLGQVVWAAGDFVEKRKYEREGYSPARLFKLCVEADDGGFQARMQRKEARDETKVRDNDGGTQKPADDRSGGAGANSVGDILRDMPEVLKPPEGQGKLPTEEGDT
jgi:hypothetical protein